MNFTFAFSLYLLTFIFYFLKCSSLNALRKTFPTIVLGSSARNSTCAGTLYGASSSRQNVRSSSSEAVVPTRSTTQAFTASPFEHRHAGHADLTRRMDASPALLRSRAATPGTRSS